MKTHAQLAAEFIGTFFLVFIGCGTIIVSTLVDNPVPLITCSLAFGLTVAIMIYTLGDISGAHINPAVTVGLALTNRFPVKKIPSYVTMQILGAVLASVFLFMIFGNESHLGSTLLLSGVSVHSGFIIEVIATLFLVFVVISLTINKDVPKSVLGFVVGCTVSVDILFAGPLTMASLNPARSLGPALISGTTAHQWIFIAAPLTGAVIASLLYRVIRGNHYDR
ncbi:MAG: aquaporin [Theionarchaea archaeon]|nr:aquaporin [Theionarchaea archaeon]